ncbi:MULTISPECIES: hypothetical protein [unclassified Variovorax]
MALDMYLEMNGDLKDWESTKEILYEAGMVSLPEHRPDAVWYTLGNGEVFCEAQWRRSSRRTNEIIAEGDHRCSFLVNAEISFRINNSTYDEAVSIIKTVLTHLTERTGMLFVLSFQYEDVRAIRDRERGFEWFWNDPR